MPGSRAFGNRRSFTSELYICSLLPPKTKKHHILSGESPNGLSNLYERINREIFEGRGLLQVQQPGLSYGSFKPMDTLNDGAHVSFRAFVTCIGLIKNPEYLDKDFADKYFKHLNSYCNYLNYMHDMFKAGKSKDAVLAGVKNLHKPASYWAEQQKLVKEKRS